MKTAFSLFLFLLVTNCGKDEANKSLFSSWAATTGTFTLDLTGGSFGTFSMYFILTGHARCNCTILLGGTEASGTRVATGCTYVAGTGSGTDPGCSALNSNGTFSKTATELTICNSSGACTKFQ